MKLKYSPQSVADLQRLYEFIAVKNRLGARKIAVEIQECAEKLKLFPLIGLPVTRAENSNEVRDLYVGNYTLRYFIKNIDTVYVLRIWHNKEIEKDLK
jgi:toxin ParE1/3/4